MYLPAVQAHVIAASGAPHPAALMRPAHRSVSGNNRTAWCFASGDYSICLDCLGQGLGHPEVRLHACVLMTNHVPLLMTLQDETGISRLSPHVGRFYVLHQ
jgi:putative transposase